MIYLDIEQKTTIDEKELEEIIDFLQEKLDCAVDKFVNNYDKPSKSSILEFECSGCKNIAGEDWIQCFYLDFQKIRDYDLQRAFSDALEEAYNSFDINENVRMWAETAGNGVTPSFRKLVDNAEYKKKKLLQLCYDYEYKRYREITRFRLKKENNNE